VVDNQNSALLTILVFGVGTDYALLLIARDREALHHHEDVWVAMVPALRCAAQRGHRRVRGHRGRRSALPARRGPEQHQRAGPVGAAGILCARWWPC
jgi:RND superfamily putative drug exporter